MKLSSVTIIFLAFGSLLFEVVSASQDNKNSKVPDSFRKRVRSSETAGMLKPKANAKMKKTIVGDPLGNHLSNVHKGMRSLTGNEFVFGSGNRNRLTPGGIVDAGKNTIGTDPSGQSRIIGGTPATRGDYPWFGIPVEYKGCGGGFLIWEDILLAAAGCRAYFTDTDFYMNATQLNGNDATEIVTSAFNYPHPLYNVFTNYYDIMIVKLSGPSTVTPVSWNADPAKPVVGATARTIGYGATQLGPFSDVLLEADLTAVNSETCQAAYGSELVPPELMVCAAETDKGPCQGDAGSPLFEIGSNNAVIGIASWGECGSSVFPSVFTRVSSFDEWIQQAICTFSDNTSPDCQLLADPTPYPFAPSNAAQGEYPGFGFASSDIAGCGSVLIHEDVLLTAATCLFDFYGGPLQVGATVKVGGSNRLDPTDGEIVTVQVLLVHPEYNPADRSNDIMLVKITRSTAPVKPWSTSYPDVGFPVDLVGFSTFYDAFETNLLGKHDSSVILSQSECGYPYICVDGRGYPCVNDVGGPLYDDSGTVVGIGGTFQCDYISYYSSTAAYQDFIQAGICDLTDTPPGACSPSSLPSFEPSTAPSPGPSAVPSSMPSSTPVGPSNADDDDDFCFSGSNTVVVKGKGIIKMENLKIGDYVKVDKNAIYSPVFSFGHFDTKTEANYLRIYTTKAAQPLEISDNHMVMKGPTAVRAGDIKVGDGLSSGSVIKIDTVKRRGLYAPHTESGEILVSGTKASCYVTFVNLDSTFQHYASHAFHTPWRMLCKYGLVNCLEETYTDGISDFYSGLVPAVAKLSGLPAIAQIGVAAVGTPILASFYVAEQLLFHPALLVGFVAGFFYVRTWKNKSNI